MFFSKKDKKIKLNIFSTSLKTNESLILDPLFFLVDYFIFNQSLINLSNNPMIMCCKCLVVIKILLKLTLLITNSNF